MNFIELEKKYQVKALQHANAYHETPSKHIINIMTSVMMSRDNVLPGGSFVQSVVKNDLLNAVCRADKECVKNLKLITLACANAFIDESNE